VDGRRCFPIELLVDDAFDQRLEWGLRAGDAEGKWAGAGNQLTEFGVGGGEFAAGEGGIVAR
jgi:hypothetical protein